MRASVSKLIDEKCRPLPQGSMALEATNIARLHAQISSWSLDADRKLINRTFKFKNYYETMAFANAVAWIAHQEDHHPDMTISYNQCKITFSTHSVGGLSDNDFICAAKIDAIYS